MQTTTETIEDVTPEAAWNAGLDEVNKTEQADDKAPSDEGVVISEGDDSTAEKPEGKKGERVVATGEAKEEPKPRPPGQWSHTEILEKIEDPDVRRAVELQLNRSKAIAQETRRSVQTDPAVTKAKERSQRVKQGIDSLEEDYPELKKKLEPLKELADDMVAPAVERAQTRTSREIESEIEAAFSGWRNVVKDDSFKTFFAGLPADVRNRADQTVSGTYDVLELYESHITQQGNLSPFAPAPSASKEPDIKERAAAIQKRREMTLATVAPVPTGARPVQLPNPQVISDPVAAWNAGLQELARKRNYQ